MRPTRLTALVLLGWMLGSLHADAGRLTQKITIFNARKSAPEPKIVARWKTDGVGDSHEDAYLDGVDRIRQELHSYLAKQGFQLEIQPSVLFLESLIKSQQEGEQRDLGRGGISHQVFLVVELSNLELDKLLLQDRQIRAEGRMLSLAKILFGLVAFLAVLAGYFRLEEATKGYYTNWLRLAALGFLFAAGAGLWWFSLADHPH